MTILTTNVLIEYFMLSVSWVALSVTFHEAGHYIVAKLQGFKAKLVIDRGFAVIVPDVIEGSYKDARILAAGIIGGYLPTLAVVFFINESLGALLFIAWSVGNIREIILLWKWSNK